MVLAQRLLLCLLLGSLSGCQSVLEHTISQSPNHCLVYRYGFNLTEEGIRPGDLTWDFYVPTGPPHAAANIWVGGIEPCCQPPVGTAIVLHGVLSAGSRSPGNAMYILARHLSAAGYRAILPDLRGHGRSSSEFITGGQYEASDMAQVLDELQCRGLIAGRIGIVGHSLGAGSAIILASYDARVSAVVAVATPRGSIRQVLPHFVWTNVPFARRFYSCDDFQRAIDRTALPRGVDPEATNTCCAIRRTTIPISLINGEDDATAPPCHGYDLQRSALNCNAVIEILPGRSRVPEPSGHSRLIRDDSGAIRQRAVNWFDSYVR